MRSSVAIVGAGPVGCAAALALAHAGHAVVVVAAPRAEPVAEAFRPIALSHASRLLLERIGAWDGFAATPIRTIHVSQARGFGRTRIEAAEAGVPALGYVVEYAALAAALAARVRARAIPVEAEAPRERSLLVHAEGACEDGDEKNYRQQALVARVGCRPPAAEVAYERFTPEGPLALLPLAGDYGLVWVSPPERAAALEQAPEAVFLQALARSFGARAGTFTAVGERSRVPLVLRVRASRTGVREVFIGNRAQTLHPVAGQGLNLGLRDAWALAQLVQEADDPGDARLLARYARARALDVRAAVAVTDFLAAAFLADDALARAARGAALATLDTCAPLRRFFARRMIFGAAALP